MKKQEKNATKKRLSTGLPSDYKAGERIISPIPGIVTQVHVQSGMLVKSGDPLLIIEAMKMRNMIRSAKTRIVTAVHIKPNQVVKAGEVLIEFSLTQPMVNEEAKDS